MRIDDHPCPDAATPLSGRSACYLTNGETYDVHHPDMIWTSVRHTCRVRARTAERWRVVRIVSLVTSEDEYLPPLLYRTEWPVMPPPDDSLDRLHRDLELKRLNPLWAKVEILLGLFAVACGLVGGMKLAVQPEAAVPDVGVAGSGVAHHARRVPRARRAPQPPVSIE